MKKSWTNFIESVIFQLQGFFVPLSSSSSAQSPAIANKLQPPSRLAGALPAEQSGQSPRKISSELSPLVLRLGFAWIPSRWPIMFWISSVASKRHKLVFADSCSQIYGDVSSWSFVHPSLGESNCWEADNWCCGEFWPSLVVKIKIY